MDSSNLTDLDYVYDVSSKPLGVRRGFGECGRRDVLALASIREGQFSRNVQRVLSLSRRRCLIPRFMGRPCPPN